MYKLAPSLQEASRFFSMARPCLPVEYSPSLKEEIIIYEWLAKATTKDFLFGSRPLKMLTRQLHLSSHLIFSVQQGCALLPL
jgi:hypothetical protein